MVWHRQKRKSLSKCIVYADRAIITSIISMSFGIKQSFWELRKLLLLMLHVYVSQFTIIVTMLKLNRSYGVGRIGNPVCVYLCVSKEKWFANICISVECHANRIHNSLVYGFIEAIWHRDFQLITFRTSYIYT